MSAAESDLADIVLLDIPLDVRSRSLAHHDELVREFRLILSGQEGAKEDVPGRLLTLIEDITSQYSAFTASLQTELDDAFVSGEKTRTARFQAPPTAYEFCERLCEMLEESDRYCRDGQLLTLEPSTEALTYRRWYLGEVMRQLRGAKPTSWADFVSASQDSN